MSQPAKEIKLENGTIVRHKVAGYEGRIDGTTGIKTCFTAGGTLLEKINNKEIFQYRVAVAGESMRRVAPAEDLEILDGVLEIVCPACHYCFRSRPGVVNKAAGLCQCGGWICPACGACRPIGGEAGYSAAPPCVKQRERQIRKLAVQKKRRDG